MDKIKPISPAEAVKNKKANVPDQVIEAFNELITEKLIDSKARITQNEAIARIQTKLEVGRQTIFDSHWLDVEAIYKEQGWEVEFDKPGYNEIYTSFFVFTIPF